MGSVLTSMTCIRSLNDRLVVSLSFPIQFEPMTPMALGYVVDDPFVGVCGFDVAFQFGSFIDFLNDVAHRA